MISKAAITKRANGEQLPVQTIERDYVLAHLWHVHRDTAEFVLVLDGRFNGAMRDTEGDGTTIILRKGDTFVVPKGTEHEPSSPDGADRDVRATGDPDDWGPWPGEIPGAGVWRGIAPGRDGRGCRDPPVAPPPEPATLKRSQ
ncbi:MAG: cupin domain-containing protein [Acidimicrobiales bacterium]